MARDRLRICVVTGSRADYGLLVWPVRRLLDSPRYEVQLVATGQHLSPDFGETWREIEADGFTLAARVPSLVPGDTASAVARSLGQGVLGFADAFQELDPDLVMVLGDRFEILAAAQVAMIMTIPLVHIAGGDVTEGAFDDSIRHAITKMAQLHLVTNEDSRRRVIQLGEAPDRVHLVGSPGLDTLRHLDLLDRAGVEDELGVELGRPLFLVTFHPVTRGRTASMAQLDELLAALDRTDASAGIVFTMANSDPQGLEMTARVESWCSARSGAHLFASLGSRMYLSLMSVADCVVGNSSSGLYEAPALSIPTVNVGDRQAGRPRARSVLDAGADREAIAVALERALTMDLGDVGSPFGDGHASERIVDVLDGIGDPRELLSGGFFDPSLP